MKSYLKLLMAIILVLSCIAVFASCGETNQETNDDSIEIVIPPSNPEEETYLVQFVYRYYLTYINDYDRMESKPFTERKVSLYIPVENEGFTAEHLAQIAGIKHNGYSFADWYLGWDEDNYQVTGDAFDFTSDNAPITSDLTFYAYRGNLAGETATWEIQVEGEGKSQETVLYINGTGKTFDYEAVTNIDIPWYADRAKITKIVIADGITDIGANTFNGLYAVDTIEFPDSLITVGTSSFRGMTKLTSLVTPANLKVIGSNAFAETSLKSVIFNEGLEEIGETAFNESNKIVSIIIPSTLKTVKGAAFHPGSVDGKVNSSALKTVYSLGTEDDFLKVDIGLDNAWFNELASVYFKPADGMDPSEVEGPYWDFFSYENEDGETIVTDTPVPYYYMIKYYLDSNVYGVLTPIYVDYVATTATIDADGLISVKATVDQSHVEFADSIVYHNFKFVKFTNGVTSGLVLSGDRSVTCDVYSSTRVSPSATATGTNKGYLSNKGGIVWEFSFATKTLTISLGAKPASVEGAAALLAKLADYKEEITADTLVSDIFGIESSASIKEITDAVGFTSVEEFADLAAKLAALEISGSNDPLIATAAVLADAGIVSAEDLAALVVAINAEGAAEDAALQATLAALAQASLDTQNLKDLNAKLVAAGITGSIADEFASLKAYLEAFEAQDVLITDIHAAMIARSDVMQAIEKASITEFKVGNAEAFDAAITVADLVEAISDLQDADGLFFTWDYETSEDTSVMWASSRSYTSYVKNIVVSEGVKHLGSYVFANLPSIVDVTLPASLESIDVTTFDGCPNIKTVYCAGESLTAIEVRDAARSSVAGDLFADRILQGNYADVFCFTPEATAEVGKFWTNVGESRIAWNLSSTGKLEIGGPSMMVDFATPEEAPWYGAKDSIAEVVISGHLTSVGENIVNGYAGVRKLNIGEGYGAVKYIPASAFAGTAVLNGEGAVGNRYDKNGMLIVTDYLIGYNGSDEFVKVPFYTVSIAEGVFDNNANLEYVYIPQTILGLHKNVFTNNVPTIFYFEGGSAEWYNICGNLEFPEDAVYYVALSARKAEDDPNFFFSYKQTGNEFELLDGCIHDFTAWVETHPATCTKNGSQTRSCTKCLSNFVSAIPALGHEWTEWTPDANDPTYEERWCTAENCDAKCSVEGCTVHADHTYECEADCTEHKNAAHVKVMINSEYTFEGIEAVEDNQIKLSDTTNSKYTIVEIGTDAHAFEYEKTSNEVTAEFTVFATQAGNIASAKVVTYQSQIKIDNTNKKVSIDLVFRSEADPSVKAMVLNLLATDGKNLDIGAKDSGEYVSIGVKTGDWFNLKVEYYAEGDVAVAKVYVNETLVYVSDAFLGETPVSAGVADSVSFVPSANFLGKISLDNVTLTQGRTYTFDGVTSLIKPITFDEIPPASLVKVDGTATIVTADDGNKYYSINRTSTSTGYYTFYSQSNANSANVAIFESRVQFTRLEENGGSRAYAIRFRGGSQSNAYMLEVRHDANTGTLYFADKSESKDAIGYKSEYVQPKDAEGNLVNIQVGDWYTVRIEYYEAKAGDAESVRILTYVNDVLVLYSNNWYGVTTEQEVAGANVPHPVKVSEITDAYIQPYTSHRGEWNIDNTVFYKTYAQAPTDPVTLKYDDYDGGAIDNGGVIRTDWVQEDDRAKALANLVNDIVDENEEDIYVPEEEVTSKYVSFENMDAVPSFISKVAGDGTLEVTAESGNKFFRVNEGSSSTRFIMTLTEDKVENANATVFEARIRYNIVRAGGNGGTNMFFITDSNTNAKAFEFQFNYTEGNNITISTRDGIDADGNETTQKDFQTDVVDTGVALNEWFAIKLIYSDSGKLTVYINETNVLESNNFYFKNADPVDASVVDSAWFVPFGSTTGNIDFDDIAFYQEALEEGEEEEPVLPPEEQIKMPIGSTTFDEIAEYAEGQIGKLNIGGTIQQNATCEFAIVSDGANKVLSVNKTAVNGSQSVQTWINIGIDPTADVAGKDIYFETRMKVNTWTNSGSGIYLRLYSGRNPLDAGGTNVSGNIAFGASNGVTFDSVPSNAAIGDYFILRIVMNASGYTIYVSLDDGETFNTIKTNTIDCSTVDCVTFMTSSQNISDLWFDYIYFGAEPVYNADEEPEAPEEEPETEVLEGTMTFEDYAAGEWTVDTNASIIINHMNLGQAQMSNLIVTESGNKYLSLEKTLGGTYVSGQPGWQTAMAFQKNMDVPEGSAVVFEADMRVNFTKGSAAYFRFYTDFDATKNTITKNGTLLGENNSSSATTHQNINLNKSGSNVVLDYMGNESFKNIVVGTIGEWFSIRLVLLNGNIDVYLKGEDGKYALADTIVKTGDKWANFSLINAIVLVNDSGPQIDLDLDNVYFGEYIPEVESPIENLPAKENDLAEGTLTFNSIEEAALPENIVTLMDEANTLGAVSVARGNKVLNLKKAADTDATFYLNATKKTVGADVLAFASQMYFDSVAADGSIDITLMPSGSAEADRVYKIRLSVVEGSIFVAPVALVDGADVVGEAIATGVSVGDWFKLSIVYSEADSSFVVSVNGDALITSTAAYGMLKDASAISQVAFVASSALAADVYFENMALSQLISE